MIFGRIKKFVKQVWPKKNNINFGLKKCSQKFGWRVHDHPTPQKIVRLKLLWVGDGGGVK